MSQPILVEPLSADTIEALQEEQAHSFFQILELATQAEIKRNEFLKAYGRIPVKHRRICDMRFHLLEIECANLNLVADIPPHLRSYWEPRLNIQPEIMRLRRKNAVLAIKVYARQERGVELTLEEASDILDELMQERAEQMNGTHVNGHED
jgi:hypothetical protein